jgi:hypothetical protein
MQDRELKKVMSDNLFDLLVLKKASAERREKLIDKQIARAKVGMTAEEVAHVSKLAEEAPE